MDAYPNYPTCLEPVDMAGHRQGDYAHSLKGSGSYPSTHALIGMFWGITISAILDDPKTASEALAAGIDFGESRVICGFHYESDVVAGRLAAGALFAKLAQNDAFKTDLKSAKEELAEAVASQRAGAVHPLVSPRPGSVRATVPPIN